MYSLDNLDLSHLYILLPDPYVTILGSHTFKTTLQSTISQIKMKV